MRNPRLEINAEGVAQVSKAANAHVIIREACRTTFTANVVVIGRVRPGDRGCPSFAAEKEGAGAISLKQGQTRMSLVPEPQVVEAIYNSFDSS
ncbi:Hypothetical protein SMAX5B_021296 [Scophthalmus maximus]|uniref:Uncharacterized protein n=1 Tax=Scophthalmus maximus TaxID=52904 RepID=A0A2U9AWE0_SCOMX|nr:Hypothetical protein SMAX5B_021296 [Scophthalmus maximus]